MLKLAAFDLEGCLTGTPTLWEIMHRKCGTWESHGAKYWDRFVAGEFDYDTFARMDVETWRGKTHDLLREASNEVAITAGCFEMLDELHAQGVTTAIISNGLSVAAERFRERGVKHIFANHAEHRGGKLTGNLILEMPWGRKGDVLEKLMAETGAAPDETIAVGDGISDIDMFKVAGTSIAFCSPYDEVRASATHIQTERNLTSILQLV